MSLVIDEVIGILNDARHAACLVSIIQSGAKFIEDDREHLR